MTNERVSNFASELAQMAMASQRLPEVERERDELSRDLDRACNTIQRLELKLLDRAGEIDTLHALLRAEEAKRSDAETMFLECDDAKSTLERTLESLGKDIAAVLQAVSPVPEPVQSVTVKPEVVLEPRDTFQGVKSDPVNVEWPLADGPLSPKEVGEDVSLYPFAPSPSPGSTPSTDASSNDAGSGQSESPLANGTSHLTDTPEPLPNVQGEGLSSAEGVSVPAPFPVVIASDIPSSTEGVTANDTATPSANVSTPKPHHWLDDDFHF